MSDQGKKLRGQIDSFLRDPMTRRMAVVKGVIAAAGGVGYAVSASGAVTTQALVPGGVLNVKDFGAKGDNQTDDSKAIQQAVDTCTLGPYVFGAIYFPRSEAYLIRKPIKVPRANQGSHIRFIGDGARYSAVAANGCNAFEEADAPLPGATNENGLISFEHLTIATRDGYRGRDLFPYVFPFLPSDFPLSGYAV